ncbi:MAG TPA: carboxymuconolactone decarboxylase family protein [Burkholderiales bacterium]|nr:carboxymuconolactone decarboxylase family protein [Burkholderiales bacterium]
MDQRVKPAPRLAPLPPAPELKEVFAVYEKALGFIPNSVLIMQRKPNIARAFAQLSAAINADPDAQVDRGFKRLIAHVASRAAGCRYCMAHTAGGAMRFGVDEAKLAAVWEYRSSPLYSEGERVALDFALAASSVPNDVTDEMFAELRKHWNDTQVVEIVAVIATFGFLNRWNDTMATPLEAEPIEVGEKHLAPHGWQAGKHLRSSGGGPR